MVLIAQLSRIGCNLLIQSREVRSCGIFRLDIGTICCRTNFCIHRAAGYQLLRAICFRIIRIRFRGISNLACTDCFTPRILAGLLCCFSPCFYIITITRVFNGVVTLIKLHVTVLISLIDFDILAHIGRILQLLHDNSIVIFNTISCFDETVVSSGLVFIFCYSRCLGIIIARSISIDLTVRQLFPFDGITGHIPSIMTKSNRVCFIRRGLIADGCAVLRRHDGLPASSQRIIRIFASGTASYTD